MLHPLMPFITEELWNAMPRDGDKRPYELIVAKWPEPEADGRPRTAKAEMEWLIRLVSEIRSARTELNIPVWRKVTCGFYISRKSNRPSTRARRLLIERFAHRRCTCTHWRLKANVLRTGPYDLAKARSAASIPAVIQTLVINGETWRFRCRDVVDVDAEKARLAKAAEAAEKERDSLAARLANPAFVERAKAEAVDKARSDHAEKSAEAERYRAALDRLG
jgi:valyl-tRNA synthetase